jgi:hypothetical protein
VIHNAIYLLMVHKSCFVANINICKYKINYVGLKKFKTYIREI